MQCYSETITEKQLPPFTSVIQA